MTGLYRALLLLYPRSFRERYAEELLDLFAADASNPRHRGWRGRLRLWRYLVADLAPTAARQRYRQAASLVRRHTRGAVPSLPHNPQRGFMETLVQDVRHAFRQFARRPGFTAVAVLSLTLGIGGTSIIYGLLDGLVFNPFSYPDPDRLVGIGATFPKVSSDTTYVETLSPAEYQDIRALRSFAHTGAFDLGNRNVSGGDVPERVFTALLLDDLFPVMGVRPLLGRGFTREELAPGGPSAAIISHRLWHSRFAADPRILERVIRIGGQPTAIVGVMPPSIVLIGTDLWMPWGADPARVPRSARQFTVLARLAPGVSRRQANAELEALALNAAAAHGAQIKEYDGWRLTATPWAAALMQDVRPAAFIVLVAVGLVLLIACANLTNLMLAQATLRTRELAVRLALGAGRWRLARQLVTESLLLALLGAAGAVLLARAVLPFGEMLIPAQLRTLGLTATVNLRVLGWSVAAAVAAGLLVAVLPALQATRTDANESLKSDSRSGLSRRGTRSRHALIVVEIALSVVLLLGAGLLMRSFLALQHTDLGYEPRGVLTMRLTLPVERYRSSESVTSFFEELTGNVGKLPEVKAAAMASQLPPGAISTTQIEVEGMQAPAGALASANLTVASRQYFRTVGVPLRGGRFFDTEDRPDSPPRVIVNEAFVRQHVRDGNSVGRRMRTVGRGGTGPWAEIVGVVGDARNSGVATPVRPEVFIPMEQGRDGWNQLFLLVRTDGEPARLLPQVREVVRALDPEQPVYAVQTLDEALQLSAFQQRTAAVLLGVFAALALAVSAIGIYGVMSYTVTARTQEIGVRMALGAERSHVLRLVLTQVGWLVVIGTAIGTGLLLASGGALKRLLYGVTPMDPLTICTVTVTLAAVAVLAAWIPARRASRVNPINALRYE